MGYRAGNKPHMVCVYIRKVSVDVHGTASRGCRLLQNLSPVTTFRLFGMTSDLCLIGHSQFLGLRTDPLRIVDDHVLSGRGRTLPRNLGDGLDTLHPNLAVFLGINLLLLGRTSAPMGVRHERIARLALRFPCRPDAVLEKVGRIVLVLDPDEAFKVFTIGTLDRVRMGRLQELRTFNRVSRRVKWRVWNAKTYAWKGPTGRRRMDDVVDPVDGRGNALDVLFGHIDGPLMQGDDGVRRLSVRRRQTRSLAVRQGTAAEFE